MDAPNYSAMYSIYLIKSIGKLLIKPQHWKQQLFKVKLNWLILRVALKKRYTVSSINLFGRTFELVDSTSFIWTFNDIFGNKIYNFKTLNKAPIIIDGGANIGLSILYFKQLYPNSHIIAFEPDVKIFNVLEKNIKHSSLSNVELINKALWSSETVLEFKPDGADGGSLYQGKLQQEKYQVPTVRLRDYLNKPIDLLKLDIEGAETQVIEDCYDLLTNVQHLFVEYHSFAEQPQSLNVLIKMLSQAGFRLHIHTVHSSPQPFCDRELYAGMDLQLNIFAFRE
jgi:FkbM family methyltransferase